MIRIWFLYVDSNASDNCVIMALLAVIIIVPIIFHRKGTYYLYKTVKFFKDFF